MEVSNHSHAGDGGGAEAGDVARSPTKAQSDDVVLLLAAEMAGEQQWRRAGGRAAAGVDGHHDVGYSRVVAEAGGQLGRDERAGGNRGAEQGDGDGGCGGAGVGAGAADDLRGGQGWGATG